MKIFDDFLDLIWGQSENFIEKVLFVRDKITAMVIVET